jgi:hypothetical protein
MVALYPFLHHHSITLVMTDSTNTAFPRAGNSDYPPQQGVSVREYFAALAMQGLLASTAGTDQYPDYRDIGERAVHYADALIIALNKIKNPQTQ